MSAAKPVKLTGDLAMDVGSVNTRIFAKDRGVVLDEPSVVAMSRKRGRVKIIAVGGEAAKIEGRAPVGIEVVRPIRSGAIADLDAASEMIRCFLGQARHKGGRTRPALIMTVPAGSTAVERRLLKGAADAAGARRVMAIEGSLAAAIGAGLPVDEPDGAMVVDIGGGTTDVAVLALGGVVYARSADVGGEAMDDAIIAFVRRQHRVLIGSATAETVKREIGTAYRDQPGDGRILPLRGQDLERGVPKEFGLSAAETAESLIDPITEIYEGIKLALEHVRPDLGDAIAERGILMTGGGSLLHNLSLVVAKATGLPVTLADDPLGAAINGVGLAMRDRTAFRVSRAG